MRQQNNEKIRSSHRSCSIKKVLLKNLGKFTGKHLRRSLIFNKSAGLLPATLFEKKFRHRYFVYEFWKIFNPIQDGHFRGCSWMGGGQKGPLPKICHEYPTMMKLGEDPKNIWITWHNPWVLLTSEFFYRKSADLVISRNTDIDYILIHNF